MAKKKKKLSKAGRIILDLILVLALGMAAFSGYKLFHETERYRVAQRSYKDLKENVLVKAETEDENKKVIDWGALQAVNSDIGLWIEMEDSSIDYPVIYQDDNEFFLRHLPDGTWNEAGTIFVDMENSREMADRNTVFYGHHMLDEPLMFAEFENFEDQAYADAHKEIRIYSPDNEWVVYPVGGFVTDGTEDYVTINFSSDDEYQEYIDMLRSRSVFSSDVSLTKDDQMALFSTCSYDVNDGRFVLFGKVEKVEDKQTKKEGN